MNYNDLKTGDIVTLANDKKYVVMKNIGIINDDYHERRVDALMNFSGIEITDRFILNGFNGWKDDFTMHPACPQWDIVKIERIKDLNASTMKIEYDVIWER